MFQKVIHGTTKRNYLDLASVRLKVFNKACALLIRLWWEPVVVLLDYIFSTTREGL